jgi:hypothetical protein
MVDIRIYRAAFIATLLALAVVSFSLEDRPAALTNRIAPDAFDGAQAVGVTEEITSRFPSRAPGSAGDEALGDYLRKRFEALGLNTSVDSFEADGTEMRNVTGTITGRSDRQVVLLAYRDADRRPGAISASGTAALLEMARAVASSSHDKTFVLVSTDGGTADSAGARRFADHYPDRSKIDAAFALDDIAAATPSRPYLIPWSEGSNRGPLQILRTSEAALQRELGEGAGYQSWGAQFLRQAWPLTLREQGPLVNSGINAISFTTQGEVPRAPAADTLQRISEQRMTDFGRAALSAGLAYDSASTLSASPKRYVVAARKLMPGWAIAVLALGLLLPAMIAAVDAFARARRKGEAIGGYIWWVVSAAVPFAVTLAAAWVFQLADWLPASPGEAISPISRPGFGESAPALIALVLLFMLGWLVLRPALLGHERATDPMRPSTAAVALALVFSVEVLLVWAANPFAALLLVPAAHLCLLAAFPERPSRTLLLAGVSIGALALPAIALAYYGVQFDLGLHVGSYLLLLVTSATSSLATGVLCALVGGSLVSTVLIAIRVGGRPGDDDISVRGPVGYAGPGSLGGTSSALPSEQR